MPPAFAHRHLLGIAGLTREELVALLDLAQSFVEIAARPVKKVPTLRGKSVVNLFYESSTRTRTSFELAGKRLSADVVNVSASTSSATKGESLVDTARNLEAMAPDVLVVRHASAGAPHQLARLLGPTVGIVNAGDGAHEHPTQALLDCLTLRQHLGALEGRTVVIVGDIRHSRVARSNALALRLLGARVRVCGPPTLLPQHAGEALGVEVFTDLRPALADVDAIMMLRVQLERGAGVYLPTLREYSRLYGLSERTLAWAPREALVLHPGPVNRGVELSPEVADGARSVILEQVANGVAVRMAVLYLLAGGGVPTAAHA